MTPSTIVVGLQLKLRGKIIKVVINRQMFQIKL